MRHTADWLLGRVFEMDYWVSPNVSTPVRFTVNEVKGDVVTAWSHSARRPEKMSLAAVVRGLNEGLIYEVAVPPYSRMVVRDPTLPLHRVYNPV